MTGCATERAYEGPPLPPRARDRARRPGRERGLPVQIRIRRVDGQEIGLSASKVELPAGAHSLLVDCRVAESGSVRRFTVEDELDAGRSYRLVADTTARNCEAVGLIDD